MTRREKGRRLAEPALRDLIPTKSPDLLSVDPLDAIARHIGGTFVVVVEVTAGKYLRRCYLSAKAAQNAAQRAVERGETATVYLAELKPLWKVRASGEPHGGT